MSGSFGEHKCRYVRQLREVASDPLNPLADYRSEGRGFESSPV